MTATVTTAEHQADPTSRRPLRVVHVLDTFEVGGAQRVAAQLGAWTAERGCEVTLLGREGALRSRVDPRLRTEVTTERGPLAELLQLVRLVRRTRPDVLHAHQRREALLCAVVGRLLGVPVVEHAHTLLPDRGRRALSFRSARVFAVSEHVRRMVTDDFGRPAERVLVVGNTAAEPTAGPTTERTAGPIAEPTARQAADPTPTPTADRGRSPARDDVLRLVALGRVTEQKDPLRFVRVVHAVAASQPVRAVWHGEGPLLHEARRTARELDAPVTFAGPTDAVAEVLDAAHALVLTSAWEGMPLVALEAFGRGCPVVATAACGAPGLLDDGRAVVVDDDADDDAFARAVVEGLRDPDAVARRVGAARRWLDEHGTPEAVFGPVLRTYEALRR